MHHSIEMFDLKTGDHLQSIGGFKTPHSIAFAAEKDELMVADGGDSSLVLLSGEDFHRIDRIQLIDGSATGKGDSPDAAHYDAQNRLYYIGPWGEVRSHQSLMRLGRIRLLLLIIVIALAKQLREESFFLLFLLVRWRRCRSWLRCGGRRLRTCWLRG